VETEHIVNLITLDFETFYGGDYTLTKMTTEEYVRAPQFEIILVAVKVNAGETKWFSGTTLQIAKWLEQFDISSNALLGHNLSFDGLILQHIFDLVPKMYFDTRLMAQSKYKPYTGSASLKACMSHVGLGLEKGDEVVTMFGRSRASLSHEELVKYASYCCNDVECTKMLFDQLKLDYPREELQVIDLTLRMYLEPVFELDAKVLAQHLMEVRAKKEQVLARVFSVCAKEDLMSNQKFAALLQSFGVDPPMKTSPATGKPTFAFAKSDAAWKDFAEEYENDELVSALVAARTGVKSTLEETRTERLLRMANTDPLLRVALLYYAAHTGRYGGTEKINLQNLPQPHKSKIRFALRAPVGSVVVGADLSQIEARLAAWLAGQTSLTDAFRSGTDVYAAFGSKLYGRTITRADKRERFLAKTAVLGLQYGMGAAKYIGTCRAQENIKVDLEEATKVVYIYRDTYSRIPDLWRTLDRALDVMAEPGGRMLLGPLVFSYQKVQLPNGMDLIYPHLEKTDAGYQYVFGRELRSIWGGKLLENIIQALATIVIKTAMLNVRRKLGYRPALQVHDELDYIIPVNKLEAFVAAAREIMTAPPAWCADAPIDVEIHSGANFGEVK
jgi:DNA polymerase I-like protein with 3'-5' exonuclease and polymerase domains